jgi:hypothetical protein
LPGHFRHGGFVTLLFGHLQEEVVLLQVGLKFAESVDLARYERALSKDAFGGFGGVPEALPGKGVLQLFQSVFGLSQVKDNPLLVPDVPAET